MTHSSTYSNCNRTELYQLCAIAGIPAAADESRETLVSYLLGEETPGNDEANNIFNTWRYGLTGFVDEYWHNLQTQVTCPARSRDPRACFGCLDTQVSFCLVTNPENEVHIEAHRLRKNPNQDSTTEGAASMGIAELTIENAPRDAEALIQAGRFNMRRLAGQIGYLDSEERKSAYASMTNEKQAEELVRLLQQMDAEGGGQAAAAAPPRTPSNSGKVQGGKKSPSNTKAASSNDALGAALLEEFKALREEIQDLRSQMDEVQTSQQKLHESVSGGVLLNTTVLALNLMIGEEVCKASSSDLLEQATEDSKTLFVPGLDDDSGNG